MDILVTGGAGFIGSSLVERLVADGHRVGVLDNLSTGKLENLENVIHLPEVTFLQHDIASAALAFLDEHQRYDLVYHLAAQTSVSASMRDPLNDATVNVLGTVNVADLAAAIGASKVVYTASGGTLYGEVDPEALPVIESAPHQPASPYGASKKAALDYLLTYERMGRFSVTALALANVYGPRQDPLGEAGVIGIFAHNLVHGEPCKITGDGKQTRDFVYVDDVVNALVLAGGRVAEGKTLNIGSGIETSVTDVFDELVRSTGIEATATHVPPRPGEVRRSALAIAAASEALGWQPTVSFENGIARMVETIESHHRLPTGSISPRQAPRRGR